MDKLKDRQRRVSLLRRYNISVQERESANTAICQKLIVLPEIQVAKTILSYAALPEEVDLSQLHESLRQQGKILAFPVTEGQGIMHAVVATDNRWATGQYGIREPIGDILPSDTVDLVIAPCVAFDERCRRLGRGGGYYDRYLTSCRNAVCIAVAFAVQQVDEVCTDTYDYWMDKVVTECAVYERKEG